MAFLSYRCLAEEVAIYVKPIEEGVTLYCDFKGYSSMSLR